MDKETVSARELHYALGIEKRFSAWFDQYKNLFAENEDFTSVLKGTEVQNNGGIQIRDLQDYEISIDMAKHICMMSHTEKGAQCRQYFIDLEKAWNTPEQIMARALKVAEHTQNRLLDTIAHQHVQIEQMKPKEIFADAVCTSKTSILIGELAKLICQNGYEIGQKRYATEIIAEEVQFLGTKGEKKEDNEFKPDEVDGFRALSDDDCPF